MLTTKYDERIAELGTARQKECYEAFCKEAGNITKTGKSLGISRTAVRKNLRALEANIEKAEGSGGEFVGVEQCTKPTEAPLPSAGNIKRYIFTSAQNNTKINPKVWESLKALAKHYDAAIHVSQFTYVKSQGRGKATAERVKGGVSGDLKGAEVSYDPAISGYESNDPLQVAPDLIWCGELNILPTAVNPLSGMDSYTKSASSIFPHSKIALQSVATMKHDPCKFMYTTGCVTMRNYIPQKAGLKASFHHAYGGLLVEVDDKGNWFARQLNADDTGRIYDLDLVAERGEVSLNAEGFTAYNPGDIHAASLCPKNEKAIWGADDSVVNTMKPEYILLHDLVDFRARNHHDTKDPHKNFKKYIEGAEDVKQELQGVVDLLARTNRPFCQSVVVDSNHDQATERWLKDADYKKDPVNAIFYLEATLATYRAIEALDESFHLVEWALKSLGAPDGIRFLRLDESFTVCGIQMGEHGHNGTNGARGGPNSLKKLGEKINIGHCHSAYISNGLYAAGMNGKMDQGYNKGHSSWSASDIGTYPNGKRVMITKKEIDGEVKWRL
jgi:hypothetical protein